MNFIILLAIGLVIVGLLVMFKFKELRHQFSLIFIVLLMVFFLLSVGSVFTKNKVDLTTFDGIVTAGRLYFSWLGQMAGNVIKISGYAIDQDWNLDEINISTNSSKTK